MSSSDSTPPDLHTPAMIINSLILAFTVQLYTVASAVDRAQADWYFMKMCLLADGDGLPCDDGGLPSIYLMLISNRALSTTIPTLLISLFSVLLRHLSFYFPSKNRRLLAFFDFVYHFGVLAVALLTMVNLGYFLYVIAAASQVMVPKYRGHVEGSAFGSTTFISSLGRLFNDSLYFDSNDPYFFNSANQSNELYLISLGGQWAYFNTTIYIVVGAMLASFSGLLLLDLLWTKLFLATKESGVET